MVQAVVQTTVVALQGNPVSVTAPTANQSLTWSGSAWAGAGPFLALSGGTMTGNLAAPGIDVGGGAITFSAGVLALAAPTSIFFSSPTVATSAGFAVGTGLTVSGSATISGTLGVTGAVSVGGTIRSNGSRVIAAGSGTNPSCTCIDTAGTGMAGGMWTSFGSGTNATLNFGQMDATGVPVTQFGFFNLGGNLTISGTLTQGSDQTNKTNIAPLSEGISLIRQLIPKSFAWTTSPTTTQWGFIAQDVESVIPSAVTQGPPPLSGGTTGLLGLDITGILAAVTMAVKQLDERCTALESHDGITPPAAQLA